jgi:predicted ATP-grasp superfamily ATP-dependent carboligase
MIDPWRSELPLLVTEAHAMGSLAVIRSLGRAGYPVHAASPEALALGLKSTYPVARTRCPASTSVDFVPWLRDYVRRHDIHAIVPSESSLLAIRPHFREFATLLPCHTNENVVYRAMSKFDTLNSFRAGGVDSHVPPTLFVSLDDPLPDEVDIRALGVPVFIKVDACHSKLCLPSKVIKADSAAAAVQCLRALGTDYTRALVQGYVRGVGVGAFFLRWKGQIVAEFMHRRLHEVPHSGGASSLRESWLDEEVLEDARIKLEHLDWEGVGMMEYRWDPRTHAFFLMELNARFWGSLHLALFAGVDFPKMLLDNFHDRESLPGNRYPIGVRCRQTFPGEVHHVWSVLKDSELTVGTKLKSILKFFSLTANPGIYSDLSFPGDRRLQWLSFQRFVTHELLAPVQRRLRNRWIAMLNRVNETT